MIKLLIADDEEIIRNGLVDLINWQELGYEIIGVAEDGKEALEIVKNETPDAVLTDIHMPFMNGLEFIEEVKRINPAIFCVILTGFDEFSYAKKAIDLGAYAYVLKPIETEVLMEVMEKVRIDFLKKVTEEEHINSLIYQVEQNKIRNQKYFIIKIIIGAYDPFIDDAIIKKMGFDNFIYSIGIIEQEQADDAYVNTLMEKTYEKSELLCNIGWVKYNKNKTLLWAWGDSVDQVTLSINNFVNDLIKEQARINLSKLTVSLGKAHFGMDGVSKSFNEAVEDMNHRFIESTNLTLNANSKSNGDFEKSILANENTSITECIQSGNKNILYERINELYNNAIGFGGQAKAYLQMTLAEDYIQALRMIDRYNGNIGEVFDDPMVAFDELMSLDTLEKSLNRFTTMLEDIFDYVVTKKTGKHTMIIEKAETFIQSNYTQSSLSLDMVAKSVGMSSCYLSTIFKQEKGISFVDFTTKLRIEKAKELLSNNEDAAYEISEKVGYENYSNFSRIFKKVVGVSPTTYKNKR